MRQFPRVALPIALCLAFVGAGLLAGGCGPARPPYPTARLQGSVTVDGVPIERGSISFTPREAGRGAGAGAEIVGGRYTAADVPQGKVLALFQATKETGRTVMKFDRPEPERVDIIPERYRGGLEIEVRGDNTQQDFQLTSK